MPLEKCGKAYISKSGKALMVKFESRSSIFPIYLCINREVLRKVLDNKKTEAEVMLVKA